MGVDRREPLSFDPVCGSPLPPLFEANPFCTGGYTYYFCSAMCRRFFIDERNSVKAASGLDLFEPTPTPGSADRQGGLA
jgi:YHS domain-containing protein